ncbi:MAG: extracellular solute-binding protein [Anaerolineaceae bacterium]|nr:extracellular solute-binding protein [Anaerolineaceae bacterium]
MPKRKQFHIPAITILFFLLSGLLFSACDLLQTYTPAAMPSSTAVVAIASTPAATNTPTIEPSITPTQAFYLTIPTSSLKGTQIRFWHPWQGDLAIKTATRIIEFNNTNPWGITVSFYEPGGTSNLIESVHASLDDSTWPNVVIAPSSTLANWQGEYKNLINLDEYIALAENGLTEEEISDFNAVIWQQDRMAERRFGYPVSRDAFIMLYNQSWAYDIGYGTTPQTPAQFQNQICSASKKNLDDEDETNDGTGGWIVNNDEAVIMSWLMAFEYNGLDDLYQDQYQFLDPTSVRAFRFLRYLFDSECSWNARNPTPYDYFATRQALAISAQLSELPEIEYNMKFNESPDQWLAIPYPQAEKNQILFSEGQSFALFAASPEEQMASWLFIRWMNTPAYQAEIIDATSTLPITASVLDELQGYKTHNPHWAQIVDNMDGLTALPTGASWIKARSVLSDAGWQLYQQADIENSTLAVTEIFSQVDQIIAELLDKE